MGSLIFTCPRTWRVVEPGIETDAVTLTRIKHESLDATCPHCQTKHTFRVIDGHLFTMRPRQSHLEYRGLLRDEIDAGTLITRALTSPRRS
jgi:hypothetical protein